MRLALAIVLARRHGGRCRGPGGRRRWRGDRGRAALGTTIVLFMDWLAFAKVERPMSAHTPIVTPVRGGGMTFGLAGAF